jgi:autotransporter-associated beta strand protein
MGNNVQVSALNTGSSSTGSTVGSSGGVNPTLLTVNATNGSSTFSGVIQDTLPSGSGVVALTVENGKLTLTGANTYTGSTTVSNGTLVVGTGGSIASSPTIILNGSGGSVLDASAVGGIALLSGYVLAANGGIGGNVTATSCLITPETNGPVATLTCSNNLSLNGGVTVHFDLSSLPASGNDQVVVGGALNLSGLNVIEISPLTSLSVGNYKLFVCGSANGTVANLSLTGAPGTGLTAALSVTGTEVDLIVSATAAPFVWQGDGSLNQWDYTTANWRSNGVASLFTDGAFARFDNTGANTPAIDLTTPVAPATVTVNASVNYTLGSVGGTGKITGISSLTKTNTGTLTLLTANDYTGGTFINQGTVQVGNGSATGTALGNGNVINQASLVFNQPDNYDFTNSISGTGSLAQLGAGTLTLSGNNSYSGTTTISTGTLQIGNGGTAGALGAGSVLDNSALTFNRADAVVQSGLITGTGTLTVLAGTVAVTASNDFSGLTTINSDSTLQLGNGGAAGSVPLGNVTDNGTLAFNHSVNETNSIAINGAGGIVKLDTNTLTFTAANAYNGNTAISAGTLKIGTAGTLPFGGGFGDVVLNGGNSAAGTLDINGFDTILNGITGSSNSVLGKVVNNFGTTTNALTVGTGDATTTFNGLIADNSGAGGKIALTKTGAGTFTVGGKNTYTGGTVISNGVLALDNNVANNSVGLSGVGPTNIPVVFAGGTLQLFGYNGSTSPNYNSFYNPLVVPVGQTGTLQIFSRGPSTGNPGLGSSLTGGGTLNLVVNYVRDSLDGDWSAFTGLINVTPKPAGNDEFRINNKFGYANAAIFLNDGVTMDRASGANPTNDIGELGGTSGATLKAGNSSSGSPTWRVGSKNTTATFAGTIQNDGTTSIIKVGTGTWILTGANTYAGSTTVSNGVLALAFNGAADGSIDSSTTINVIAGAFLDVSGRSDGKLPLGSSQQLRGRGTILGSLDSSGGGTIAPGGGIGGGIGTLTVTNNVLLGGTAWMKLDRAGSPTSDKLAASAITFGGTLIVTNIGTAFQVGDTFTLFSGALSGTFGTLVLPGYYTWNTSNLGVNGTISITAILPPPSIGSITISGSDLTIGAGGGAANGSVTLLSSSSLTLPLAQWSVVTTGNFDAGGNYTNTITGALSSSSPQQFYILQTQ